MPVIDLDKLRQVIMTERAGGKQHQARDIFDRYVPERAVDYVLAWILTYPFHLTITKGRDSKYGDYRFVPGNPASHHISVNEDLPPQAFLLTYLHEVAHMMVVRLFPNRVKPHGPEWQNIFSQILQPMLRPDVFDEVVLPAMRKYARKPKASSASDPALLKALHFPDHENDKGERTLMSYSPQAGFRFQLKSRTFEVQQLRGKNYLCKELTSGKLYVVKALAPVLPVVG